MKKLLIFMLVLGLASLAQAGLVSFTVGGETEIVGTAGSTYTIEVIAPSYNSFGITELMAAEVLNVNTDNQGTSWYASEAVSGTIAALPTIGVGMTLSEAGYLEDKGILFDWFSEYSTAGVTAGTVLASFSYTIDSGWGGTAYWVAPLAPGVEYLDEFNDTYYGGASTSSLFIGGDPVATPIGGLHIIPEPMTVLLLGLGGLLMRRRKG